MIADKIPAVLYQPAGNSLSVERILRMAQRCILGDLTEDTEAKAVCWDDLETLIENINRD